MDHNGKILPVNKIASNKLKGGNALNFEVIDPLEIARLEEEARNKGKKKKRRKVEPDMSYGLDANKIFYNTNKSDEDFMETLNDRPPIPSDLLALSQGVNLN